jgi:hypothetical protein
MKTTLLWLVLGTACAFSLWQKLEWAAMCSMLLLCLVTFKDRTRHILELLQDFIASARMAKLGQFEIQVDRARVPVTSFREMMLADLSPSHLGLLMQISVEKNFRPTGAVMNKLRELRNRGLISHDKETLADSSRAWLTTTGEVVANTLLSGLKGDHSVREEKPES